MVFNATFSNILVILWQSVLLLEETRIRGDNSIIIMYNFYFFFRYRILFSTFKQINAKTKEMIDIRRLLRKYFMLMSDLG
jgi:hypothetical protein